MAALTFYSNCPTVHQCHRNITIPPPPELLPNFTIADDTCINNPLLFHSNYNHFPTSSFPIHNPIKYPPLSSSYIPPITTHLSPSPPPLLLPECDPNPVLHNLCDYGDFLMNPVEPRWNDQLVCSMEPELPPLPEIYDGGCYSAVMVPSYAGGGCNVDDRKEIDDGGRGRISAQSMAARVRRRKISEKTLELGKLVPGGHRMTTAEMFQAAFKYIKFLQAQVGVLQLMQPSQELHSLVTSPLVQEKLYAAGKCIVTETLGENLSG